MNHDRFSNSLGEEYNQFRLSVPHHDKLQDKIGEIIREYSSRLDKEEIIAIDGGCGTGLTSARVLDADGRIKLLGIDNEPKTIEQARVFLANYDDRVTLINSDLLSHLETMPDKYADIFTSAWVIHNFDTQYRQGLFLQLARVLKDGGLFINSDKYARDEESSHRKDLEEQIGKFNIYREMGRDDLREQWTKHYLEDERVRFAESDQVQILEKAGFNNIKVSDRNGMEAIFTAIR